MKFSFKIQQYQTEAVDAVARVFQGQPYSAGVSYLRDMGSLSAKPQQLSLMPMADDAAQLELQDLINDSGFKNEALQLTDADLVQNIRALQAESNIHQSDKLVARWVDALWTLRWRPVPARPMFTSKPCLS